MTTHNAEYGRVDELLHRNDEAQWTFYLLGSGEGVKLWRQWPDDRAFFGDTFAEAVEAALTTDGYPARIDGTVTDGDT